MKRISTAVLALFVAVALGACTEVPVKQVEKCAKVVDVKVLKRYFLGIPQNSSYFSTIWVYKILDNGNQVEINPLDYNWRNNLKVAKDMETGKNHCWTEYERIK